MGDLVDRLARERRARLAAERLLEWKGRELFAANEKLALQARALSDQVVEERQSADAARSEAARLKGQNARYMGDLDRAHTAAVMAERRMRDALDAMRDGFALFDAGGRLELANPAWCAAFGTDLPVGTPYEALLAALVPLLAVPDAADWPRRMLARIEADPIPPEVLSFRSGRHLRLEDRLTRDGDRVSLMIDITDEMRLRAGVEALPDGFAIFDREDRLLLCNERYRALYPAAAEAITTGASYADILDHALRAGQFADVDEPGAWMQARLAARNEEVVLSGGQRIRVAHHPTPDGGRVGLHADVTAEHEARAALDAARVAAEAASRTKSAFLANMSHEIRTPMNGVVGMAELLCDTGLSEEQRLFAETIRSSGEALLVIINDILDYSKIEAGRLVLHPETFDLERLIHEVVMLLQPKARAQGIDLVVDFDVFLPTRFVGDPGRLRQILTNLVGNAVKFTAEGHVLVRVVGFEAETGGMQLHVTVEDTGIGIPPDQLEHIFGEFSQVEDASNRRFEGTGLGLAITRRLVEHMAGAIWVESRPGEGSCFGFRLVMPVAEEAVVPQLPASLRRVLVVDDSFINRTILERQLSPCGIATVLARSGAEGLAALAEGEFDLVITDHEMPDMDGVGLARALRAAGWSGPVILASSGMAGLEGGERALFASVLQKPVHRAELYRHLAGYGLDLPEAAAEAEPQEGRRMRVLVAEDNRTNQLVFAKMVKDCPVDLHFAQDGREAVALWQSLKPDLIFMDISMPEMDGREATRAIRAAEGEGARVPILALTAHAMEGDGESILAAGLDRHLTKPLRKPVILGALAEFCPKGALPVVAEAQADAA
ncbi:hybrid sensor histidine kinase/response regulator [Paragemmobacter straminiformis]|uniref:Sensory/regulatory protein RpfC n=1 Tax=Paragemmobacter straminiformis TaxID=2045119 RepID=A0A842I9F7_9RHOB|nr:response regulator [Gemmobacter straminiformis]MBC2836265.1 response regulator [Gemmobacter straminiformis]